MSNLKSAIAGGLPSPAIASSKRQRALHHSPGVKFQDFPDDRDNLRTKFSRFRRKVFFASSPSDSIANPSSVASSDEGGGYVSATLPKSERGAAARA